ncbi:50S ribosomal protein L6 [uncultured archaeon]|nr:50S ribosomal protein L6 [uncultured archaeon]
MKIQDGAKVTVDGHKVTVSGAKGTLVRDFSHPELKMEMKGGEFIAAGDKAMVNTVESHVRNMAQGVISGYTHKMKILFSHFPIAVELKGKEMMIKNFLGEKQPRRVKILGQTKVEVKGQEVTVSGPSKEEVGQTIANIKSATRIRKRDSRVFQDGFYVVE